MAVTRETMTDEQRKSVALEYLKAFDNGGVTSTGGSILDLFAEDAQVYFGKWGLAEGREQIGRSDHAGVVRHRRRLRCEVHAGVHAGELVQLLLDSHGARRAGHAFDREVDAASLGRRAHSPIIPPQGMGNG